MKPVTRKISALAIALGLSLSSTFTPNTKQYGAIAQDNETTETILEIGKVIIEIACDGEYPKRCKGEACLQGSCISFRKSCVKDDDCKQTPK